MAKTPFSLSSSSQEHKSHKNVSRYWVHLQTRETIKESSTKAQFRLYFLGQVTWNSQNLQLCRNIKLLKGIQIFTFCWVHNKGVHKGTISIVFSWSSNLKLSNSSSLKEHKSHNKVLQRKTSTTKAPFELYFLGWSSNLKFPNSFSLFPSADCRHNKGVYHKSTLSIVFSWLVK